MMKRDPNGYKIRTSQVMRDADKVRIATWSLFLRNSSVPRSPEPAAATVSWENQTTE